MHVYQLIKPWLEYGYCQLAWADGHCGTANGIEIDVPYMLQLLELQYKTTNTMNI
jgi:prepilin-type processing-associated H-X9-DG protein